MPQKEKDLKGENLISILDLGRGQIEALIELALTMKKNPKEYQSALQGKIIASLFFEASTRTRLSFEAASKRLAAGVIGFSEATNTSYGKKGESLEDTIRMVSSYSDLVVMRHPEVGAAARAAKVASVPIVNAGDGANEHPTQTLLDLMSIYESQGKIDGLKVAMVGDLKYGRTVRSLSQALALFKDLEIYYVAPAELKMGEDVKKSIADKVKIIEKEKLADVITDVDILYTTRVQKERFENPEDAKDLAKSYVLNAEMLKNAKSNLKIMHPLPRQEELPLEIDKTPFAFYFQQAAAGMWIRMALLKSILS